MTFITNKNQSGFALIAVLFSLVVLVLLFGSAQKNFVGHATLLSAQYHSEARDLADQNLDAIMRLYSIDRTISELAIDGQKVKISFQDVGGLVDLNTASPDLLRLLLTNLGVENLAAALNQYQIWRSQGYKLHCVSDFARITNLPPAIAATLAPMATVSSGRKGIDPNAAPLALLELLTTATGTKEHLASLIPENFRSPASNVNYLVTLTDTDQTIAAQATIHVANNQNAGLILQLTR